MLDHVPHNAVKTDGPLPEVSAHINLQPNHDQCFFSPFGFHDRPGQEVVTTASDGLGQKTQAKPYNWNKDQIFHNIVFSLLDYPASFYLMPQ
jgi:hypothetical protein